jgi:large subunit ribosomal protein L23
MLHSPKFTISLIRTPSLSPYHARFLVPLNFSKYDLRDYLYHAYSVEIFNIRSFVKLGHVRDTKDLPRHWFREPSKKYMTVEMTKPFLWPEDPESFEPWGKKQSEESVMDTMRYNGAGTEAERRQVTLNLRAQALRLLGGKGERMVKGAKKDAEEAVVKDMKDKKKKTLLQVWEETRSPEMLGRR